MEEMRSAYPPWCAFNIFDPYIVDNFKKGVGKLLLIRSLSEFSSNVRLSNLLLDQMYVNKCTISLELESHKKSIRLQFESISDYSTRDIDPMPQQDHLVLSSMCNLLLISTRLKDDFQPS